jgi:sortase (surface protein transpeptidase)
MIPAIGLSTRIVPVGLDSAGQMQMPAPSVAGWYRLGPAPGAMGPAVIAGHVDTYKGPAVFYPLTGIRRGDAVHVVRADGSRSDFVISKVTVVRKTTFPSHAVFGPSAKADIRLITCTGTFDTNTLNYLDSLIAWGHLARSRPAPVGVD